MTVTTIARRPFGKTPEGKAVEAITLTNVHGTSATILSYGATLQSFIGPDSSGEMADVVLGYNDLDGYLTAHNYFGATVGRFANRISGGRFELDGKPYHLACNNGRAHLHGGNSGFDRAIWSVVEVSDRPFPLVRLSHVSPDGEEGYPGRLEVEACYVLNDLDELTIIYSATTDQPTIVNITNHALFNAAGEGSAQGALGNILTLAADAYLPVDGDLIPTGSQRSVTDTAFDFTKARIIADRIRDADPQLTIGRGYDHNMVLHGESGLMPRFAARLEDPVTGRAIELFTDQPGVQFYSGNFLDATTRGKSGSSYRQGDGIALEPQHFPDSPNRRDFPSARLDPGQIYRNTNIFAFAAR